MLEDFGRNVKYEGFQRAYELHISPHMSHETTILEALEPTRWNGCGRSPERRWSAWRTSWPLWGSAGPSWPGSQTALPLTHAPTPGTCQRTRATVKNVHFTCNQLATVAFKHTHLKSREVSDEFVQYSLKENESYQRKWIKRKRWGDWNMT